MNLVDILSIHLGTSEASQLGNSLPGNTEDLSSFSKSQVWWCVPLISALRQQRKVDFSEFRASLVSTLSSRPARAI